MQAVWLALFLATAATAAAADTQCSDGFDLLREPALKLRRLGTTSTRLHFEGILPVFGESPADPATTGIRLQFGPAADGDAFVDAVDLSLAGGAGWETPRPGRWTYHARVTTGVRRVVVQEIEPSPTWVAPRAYAITVDAVGLALPPISDLELNRAMVALDASADTRACGSRTFSPVLYDLPPLDPWEPAAWEPRCKLGTGVRTMGCASGPRIRPCKVSHPEDLVRCELLQVNAAQAAYHDRHGTYFSGACGDLPGMTSSPDVACTTAGTSNEFSAAAAHPGSVQSCSLEEGAISCSLLN